MCGRYTYFPGEFSDLRLTWNVDEIFGLKPQYNIAPSQEAPVIVQAGRKANRRAVPRGIDPMVGQRSGHRKQNDQCAR